MAVEGREDVMALTPLETVLLAALRDLVRSCEDADEVDDIDIHRAQGAISDAERQERR